MKTEVPIVLARWRRSQIAETFASVRVSAPCYCLAEYIGFLSVVEPELKLVQIERQIFLADVMVRSNHAAFQQRPKTFDALRVDIPAYILASRMADELMFAVVDADGVVGAKLIRNHERCVSLRNFANKSSQSVRVRALNHFADNVTFACDCANDRHLAGRDTAGALVFLAIFPVAILVQPANERFVHFHDPHQLPELRVFHSGAKPHAHIPRCLIRASSEHPMDLQCADSLLARDHQVQDLEPHNQRLFAFLENGSSRQREAIGRTRLWAALHTLPVPRPRRALIHVIVLTTRTFRASRPASRQQIRAACFLIRKQRIELAQRQLPNETRLMFVLCFCHDSEISKKRAC